MPASARIGPARFPQQGEDTHVGRLLHVFARYLIILSKSLDHPNRPTEEQRPESPEPVTAVTPATSATVEVEVCTTDTKPDTPEIEAVTSTIESGPPKVKFTTLEDEPITSEDGLAALMAETTTPEVESVDIKDEAPWQYPKRAWRQNPIVKRYEGEAFIFIRADSFPTEPEATVPLIGWLRMHDKLCAPSKPLHSGVVRVEKVGWIITLGHDSGAMDRMILLLERKAGQNFMFQGKMHKITMDTHMPLDEWMA